MKQYRVLVVVESQDGDQERIDTREIVVDCSEGLAFELARSFTDMLVSAMSLREEGNV